MSGGYFDYTQHTLEDIADAIERAINDPPEINALRPETLARFQDGVIALKRAYIFAQRVDWLLSGDDGEDSFHDRLKVDLAKLDGVEP